jgi:hypothetical protein
MMFTSVELFNFMLTHLSIILLVAEPFGFYLGSHCLCILIPVYTLLFSPLASKFQVLFQCH